MDNLIERLNEELSLKDDKNILLAMAYGSRVNGNYNENSDLDIFLVTEYKKFISAMLIDGIKVEMLFQ